MRIELAEGKYTFLFDEKTGVSEALRYGEKWRDTIGDGFILAMAQRIEELEAQLKAVPGGITTAAVIPDKIRTAPRRRLLLELELQADSVVDLVVALENFAIQVDRGELTDGCSGGYSTGSIYKLDEDKTITHESFVKALDEYLAKKGL